MSDSSINISSRGAFSFYWNQCIDNNTLCFVKVGKSIVGFFGALFCGHSVSRTEAEVEPILQKGNHNNSVFFKECIRKFRDLNIEIVKGPASERQETYEEKQESKKNDPSTVPTNSDRQESLKNEGNGSKEDLTNTAEGDLTNTAEEDLTNTAEENLTNTAEEDLTNTGEEDLTTGEEDLTNTGEEGQAIEKANTEKAYVEECASLLRNDEYIIPENYFPENKLNSLSPQSCLLLFRVALDYQHSDLALRLLLTGNCCLSGTSVDGVKIAEEALSFFGTCGLVRGVEYLLDNGFVGANDKDSEGITPLQHAVASGKLEWVGVLLEKGADVNGTDNRGFTPLHYAAGEGHVKCLRVLVEKGAKVNVVSEGSMLPLHCAADSGSEECLNELLELDASLVDEAAGEALLTPLHYAAMRNHTGCANILMNIKDMGLNIKDIYGETAVHIASTADNTSCLDALLARPGIEVNLENNVGETALFKAVKHNRTGCIESLLGTGDIQKNALNNEGVGALFCAIRYMDSPEDFKKFLDTAGLKLDVRDRRGNTPIHYAILHSLDNLKVLLGVEGVRAQVNEKNSDGDTALHCAIKEEDGIEGYIQALCGACAQELDVEVMDNNGYTPLECLEKYGDYYETCKKQLQDKAQIQAQAQ